MAPILFTGLSASDRERYVQREWTPEARKLLRKINEDIALLGGPKLVAEMIMLENLKIYGFGEERSIKARIRSRQDSFEKRKSRTPSNMTWSPAEIHFLIKNYHLTASIVAEILGRSVHSIHRKRQKLARQ